MLLAFTAVGENRPDVIPELLRLIAESHCNIEESRLTLFSGQFAGHWFVDGNWNHIVKLENGLTAAANRYDMKIMHHRMGEREERVVETSDELPYRIEIVSLDRVGIVNEVADFLLERTVQIQELVTSSYAAPHSGAPVFAAHIIALIPADTRMISLRDEFLDFCDQKNFDAILEPIKR